MRRELSVLLAVGLLGVAACGSSSPGLTAGRSEAVVDQTAPASGAGTTPDTSVGSIPDSTPNDTSGPTVPDTGGTTPPPSSYVPNPNNAVIDFGPNKTPQPYDEFLQASIADIQDFWRETYPAVYGSEFPELTGGVWASYPGRDDLPRGCPGDPAAPYIAAGNAFYCANGDYVAYDDANLIPQITEMLGSVSAVGVVFAHEFGHAIQWRVGAILPPDTPVVYREQQADCFAGAWTARVARGESPILSFDDSDVKAGLLAMVFIKDGELGVNVFEGNAHGTAFDRVGAFQHGFIGGAADCMALETNPLPLLNLMFSDQAEANTGGNLPYDEIGDAVITDLARYWTATLGADKFSPPTVVAFGHDGPFPTCDTITDDQYPFGGLYCPSTNEILYDEDFARTLYNQFGDFSVGYVIGDAWSDAVQTQIGSSLTGEQRILINDCLTGAWTNDLIPPADGVLGEQLYISPGDLDEAVSTALTVGDAQFDSNMMGSAFEKIDNFRAGVLGGVAECNSRITGG